MIDSNKIQILNNNLNIDLDDKKIELINQWYQLFVNYNSHTNLMSKNDVEFIFEKHVFDSLAINLYSEFQNVTSILDVGTGGGFPSVILAICFNKKIFANDSRIKKINFIIEAKEKLGLDNLEIIYSRIEDVAPLNVDLIVSRAVGKIKDVYELSKKHLGKSGKFLIYKSKTYKEELEQFSKTNKNIKYEVINYSLPLKENHERNLIII